jgi:dihydrofolate reductase
MSRLCVRGFGVSLDGFGAGPQQDLEHPLGVGAEAIFGWFFPTRTFKRMQGLDATDGVTGVDDDFAARGFEGIGAWIMGRNMFGPVRGPWPDDTWKGWWGDDPPFHVPVFALTHYAREPIVMQGGTTFYFVTEGIHRALELAREAAGEQNIRLGGGFATFREYLEAGLIDEMHLAISPVLLGSGENLLGGIDLVKLGYECVESVPSESATHVVLKRRKSQ